MTEESGPQKQIKVRDLITAFESKVTTRPRARSLGDVLSKNVAVRLHDLISLNDVEQELIEFVSKLNRYEIYDKEQHVALQNEIFTILTSIAGIRSEGVEDDAKKSNLISNTQTFVSVLNKKLPSNNNTTNQYKYVTYEEFKVSKNAGNTNERTVDGNEDDSGTSITKLRRRFEPHRGPRTEKNKLYRSKSTITPAAPQTVATDDMIDSSVISRPAPSEVTLKPVSVSKLRDLFEADRKSITQGLNAISRNENFKYTVKIPYNGRREPVRTFQNSRSMSMRNLVGGRSAAKEEETWTTERQRQTSSFVWTIQKNHQENTELEKEDPDAGDWTRTVERYQVKLNRKPATDDDGHEGEITEDDVSGSNYNTYQENLGEQFVDSVEYLDSGNWTSSLSIETSYQPSTDIERSTKITHTEVLEVPRDIAVEDSGSGSDSIESVETVILNVQ